MHSQLEARLLVALGLVLASVGLVLATNFRGFAVWCARKTFEFTMKWVDKPASRVPPRSRLADSSLEQLVARQVMLGRVLGVMFAAVGVLAIVSYFVSSS
jgi:hypothetical protein